MVNARIYCFDCRATFEVYADQMGPDAPAAACPHCGAKVPETPFHKLLNAVYTLQEVEKDLLNAHDDRGEPLFSVDLRNYHTRKNHRQKGTA